VEFDSPNVEGFKELSYFRSIVQRQDKLASDTAKALCKLLEIVIGEVEPVKGAMEVRWVEIEQGFWPVEPIKYFLI
jgi:hypothetical protein